MYFPPHILTLYVDHTVIAYSSHACTMYGMVKVIPLDN